MDLLTQLNANAIGNAALPSTSDYSATDHIYITSLTPGVMITSLSNHDYAPVPEPSSAAALCFGLSPRACCVARAGFWGGDRAAVVDFNS